MIICSVNRYQVLSELFDLDRGSESFFTGPLPDHLFDRVGFDATGRLPTLQGCTGKNPRIIGLEISDLFRLTRRRHDEQKILGLFLLPLQSVLLLI